MILGRRLLVVCLVLAALVVGVGACGGGEKSGRRVVVLAIDTLDPEALDALIRRGRAPNLARLRREGTWGLLDAGELTSADAVWTTLATGVSPDRHGVFESVLRDYPLPTPELEPAQGEEVQSEPFWEIAAAQGVSAAVVGWTPLPPPEHLDRAHVVAAPESPDVGIDDLRPFLDLATVEQGFADERVQRLARALVRAEEVRRITTEEFVRERPGLLVARIDLIAAVARDFGRQAAPKLGDVDDEVYARERLAVEAAHVWCDQLVGELLDLADAETTVFVVSGRGLRSGDMRRGMVEPERHFHRWVRRHGLLLAWGAGIDHGAVIPRSALVDVVPTVLASRGLVVPESLEGEARTAVFETRVVPVRGALSVERETTIDPAPDTPSARRLRASLLLDLGRYEDALGELGNAPDGATGPERSHHEALRATALIGLGRLAEAADAQDAAQRAWPQGAPAKVSAGRLVAAQGDLNAAIEHFREAIDADPGIPEPYLLLAKAAEQVMRDAGAAHDLPARERFRQNALRVLERLLSMDPLHRTALSEAARLRLAGADPRQAEDDARAALQLLQSALQLDPFDTELMNHLAIAFLRVGRSAATDPGRTSESMAAYGEAQGVLERLLDTDPNHVLGRANLGYVHWRRGDLDAAHEAARRTLALDPTYHFHPAFVAALRAAGFDLDANVAADEE